MTVTSKIYDIQYITPKGLHRQFQIGALTARGAINNAFEFRADIKRIISAKPTGEWT